MSDTDGLESSKKYMSKTIDDTVDPRPEGLSGFSNQSPAAASDPAPKNADRIDVTHFSPLHELTAFRRTVSGIEADVDDALVRIDVLRSDAMRLRITRTGAFDEQPTHAVCADTSAMRAEFEMVESDRSVVVRTQSMSLVIGRHPFSLDAYRSDRTVIFESARRRDGYASSYLFLNDAFMVERVCSIEDAIHGLGEKTGRLNRKGRNYRLWNTDVLNPDAWGRFSNHLDESDPRRDPSSTEFDPYYVSIPLFHHLTGASGAAAGFFIDNGYMARFEFEDPTRFRYHFSGGQYTEYVFAGPGMREILNRYTELTGRIPPPPIWSLGYQQCRWHPYTQADVERLADRFRAESIPCDTLWLDIEHMNGYRVFTWNDRSFPDIEAMLDRVTAKKMRVITIVDPGVKIEPGYEVFDSGMKEDVFCKTPGGHIYSGQVWPGRTAFPDFSRPEARNWWGALNAKHVSSGFSGIWNDMNEPATGDIPDAAMRFENGAAPHEKYHNQYALLMAMSTYDGLLAGLPDQRPFILSRAGFAGIQRYAANWMGDNMARWDHLWMSLPMAMGLGLSGQAFIGADIGGFAESTNPELFLRWIQCGALTPFCRNHNNAGCVAQYPWSFGKAIADIARRGIELRYRLIPALYSAFVESSETGAPIQRPLLFDYQHDAVAREIDDEYLLGESILVAPVTTAGSTARQVYLPEGGWRNWFTGERFDGGRFVLVATPMDFIPVFVREGSVLPMWPEAPASTMGYYPSAIELHVITPTTDGAWTSRLIEDDGLTFAYQNGAFYRSDMTLTRAADDLALCVSTAGAGFAQFARREFVIVFHGETPAAVIVDGEELPVRQGTVRIPNRGESFSLTARLNIDELPYGRRHEEFQLAGA
jgi:alpha-glucosidase